MSERLRCANCVGGTRGICDRNFKMFEGLIRTNVEVLAQFGDDISDEALNAATADYETNLDAFVFLQRHETDCELDPDDLKNELRSRISR